MPTTVSSGLTKLVSDVRTYFAGAGVTANVVIGWKEAAKQDNQGPGRANRVVFVPSDPQGRGGNVTVPGPQQPGMRSFGNPVDTAARALGDWERLLTVHVWAADTTAPNDEEAQIEAVEDLFEWTLRAVHSSAKNNARWGAVDWLVSPVERQLGRELRAQLTFRHPLFDAPQTLIFPQPGAITKELTTG